jgi:hypothetical protein
MDHCVKIAKTLKDLEELVEATGLCETHEQVANSKRGTDATQDPVSPLRIHTLRKELQQMVTSSADSNSVMRLMRERSRRTILFWSRRIYWLP